LGLAGSVQAQNAAEAEKLRQQLKELEKRLQKVEKSSAQDRIRFGGDYRFEAHSIAATIPDHYDGMALQEGLVNTLFYYGATGQLPSSPGAVQQFIASHYGDYLYFTNTSTFQQLAAAMASFPPQMQQQLMMMWLPGAFRRSYDADNSLMYTNRLRLTMDADVAENVTFSGRLAMYKTWGDSTAVQVFNGQANGFDIDGNTVGVPNSAILRVERAYFTWNNIAGMPLYLSIGRRPSTAGPPVNLRKGELRVGTPMGALIDFQFDGITLGYHLGEHSTFRFCYGRGYESGFGNGHVLQQPADRLEDADFAGINWDIWGDDRMLVQTTVARAFNIDGFNGLIVFPANPLTGQPVNAPVVMRFTPSAKGGDMDIAGLLVHRKDGPFDWFVNLGYVKSHLDPLITPFGGLFSDPFERPTSHSGTMYYLGDGYTFPGDKTMVGLEYDHGSKYWFHFTPAQDDILAPKAAARGDVIEAYTRRQIAKKFFVRLGVLNYQYDYCGSSWHRARRRGSIRSRSSASRPTMTPTVVTLSMTARF
jgi:hypothetical protein